MSTAMAGLAGWLFFAPLSAALAEPVTCGASSVTVATEDAGLQERVCKTVRDALIALKACHLEQKRPILIEFDGELTIAGGLCLGLYHGGGEDRITLLTPEDFELAHRDSDFCSMISWEAHYDSIVVHELAHALLDQVPCAGHACRVAQEYVASAMQLESLPEEARARLVDTLGPTSPVSPKSINEIILAIAPARFAVTAWLHFSEPGHGCDFVGKIVRGETTFWQAPL